MSKNEEDVINIEWSGPYTYENVINNQVSCGEFQTKPTDIGLYQVYGKSPIYGENVLLYIGETADEKGFNKRLKGRGVILNNEDYKNVQIYLGKIFYDDTNIRNNIDNKKPMDIKRAESLLIHYHKPSNNSSCINILKYSNENFRVINYGSYRALHKEISTKAFTKELEIYSKINDIAKILLENNYSENEPSEEDNSYGFNYQGFWIGIDYYLWNHKVSIILESQQKIDSDFKENKSNNFYYSSLNGSLEEIIKKIKKYAK